MATCKQTQQLQQQQQQQCSGMSTAILDSGGLYYRKDTLSCQGKLCFSFLENILLATFTCPFLLLLLVFLSDCVNGMVSSNGSSQSN